MKTQKQKIAVQKPAGNPFDMALLRLGHHWVPQQIPVEATVLNRLKKS
jgi:hypothetical protein